MRLHLIAASVLLSLSLAACSGKTHSGVANNGAGERTAPSTTLARPSAISVPRPTQTLVPTPAPPPVDRADLSERVSEDRPDDVGGYQIHAMYVLPSDGMDEGLDINGSIVQSVTAFNGWLSAQTGGPRLRVDTYSGQPDVTFYRLTRTDAEMAARGLYIRDEIERELAAIGLIDSSKIYAVYYGGSSTGACGGGPWPPSLVGHVAAQYLNGTDQVGRPCNQHKVGPEISDPDGYFQYGMLHEILHALGLVAPCAPNQTQSGHVSDNPMDLMYAGPADWHPTTLDMGRDDYYAHGDPACLDLAKSVFLEPTPPDAVLPPGW